MFGINSFSKKMLDINCTSGTECLCLWFIPTTLPLISLHSEMCTCLIEYVWNGERERERERERDSPNHSSSLPVGPTEMEVL